MSQTIDSKSMTLVIPPADAAVLEDFYRPNGSRTMSASRVVSSLVMTSKERRPWDTGTDVP